MPSLMLAAAGALEKDPQQIEADFIESSMGLRGNLRIEASPRDAKKSNSTDSHTGVQGAATTTEDTLEDEHFNPRNIEHQHPPQHTQAHFQQQQHQHFHPRRSGRFYDLISQLVFEYESQSFGNSTGPRPHFEGPDYGHSSSHVNVHFDQHSFNNNNNSIHWTTDSHEHELDKGTSGVASGPSNRDSLFSMPSCSLSKSGPLHRALSYSSGLSDGNRTSTRTLSLRTPSTKAARAVILERWTQLMRELLFNDKYMLRRVWANQASRNSESPFIARNTELLSSEAQDPILSVWKRRNWIGGSSANQTRQWRTVTRKGRCVLHPDSSLRAYWACIGMLFLFVDLIYLTIAAFDVEQPVWYSLVDATYWAADLVLSFRIGVFLHGTVSFNPKTVAKQYLSTWFLFDSSLLTYQICALLFSELDNMKYLRLVRFLRIARVAKIDLMYSHFLKLSQSVIATMLMKMFLLLIAIMGWVHVSGCFFFGIGSMVSNYEGWLAKPTDKGEKELPLRQKYAMSLHWAASQLQGGIDIIAITPEERCFAVIHTLLSVVLSALLIGKLMTVLQELEVVQRSRKELLDSAFVFMHQNKIPTDLCIIVQRFLRRRARQEMRFQRVGTEERLFSALPRRIKRALLEESRWLALGKVLVFETLHGINIKFANKICCDLMQADIYMPEDSVFHSGEVAKNMFFITKGQGLYNGANLTQKAFANGLLAAGAFEQTGETRLLSQPVPSGTMLCEALMWVRWTHQGDFEVGSDNQVFVLRLSGEAFLEQVQKFGDVSMALAPHAERIAEYLSLGKRIDDLWSSEQTLRKLDKWSAESLAGQLGHFSLRIRGSEWLMGSSPTDFTSSATLLQERAARAEDGRTSEVVEALRDPNREDGQASDIAESHEDLGQEIVAMEEALEVEPTTSLKSCDPTLGEVRAEALFTHL